MRRALVVAFALASLSCSSDPPTPSPDLSPPDAAAREISAREAGSETRPGDTGGDRSAPDRKPWPTCVDGTPLGACSTQKPLRCTTPLKLEHDCTTCGCPGLEACNATTKDCEQVTVSLLATADSSIVEPAPSENHGSETTLKVGRAWNGSTDALVDFDLSSIPVKATIEKATLHLEVVGWGGTPVPASVALVTAPWAETQVSWAKAPAGSATVKSACNLDWGQNAVDATSLVVGWLASPIVPHGLRLHGESSLQGSVSLASREHATATARPRLVIRYR